MTDQPLDRPLGIDDFNVPQYTLGHESDPLRKAVDDHWYWCRRHERAEHVSEPITCQCSRHETVHDTECRFVENPEPCVRIGPFMSEREANRLAGFDKHDISHPSWTPPLGMEGRAMTEPVPFVHSGRSDDDDREREGGDK